MDDRNAPATRGDIAQLSVDLSKQVLSGMKEMGDQLRAEMIETRDQLRSEMNHHYADVIERIADSETRLLKGFYDYASGNNKRVTELEGNEAAIRSRLATLEDRMLQVEKRLNMPPAA